ncbi:MAG: peptide deformylase [Bacteroidales bacterium]|nr:peptide deformylase [Bacteroidales bacterium]
MVYPIYIYGHPVLRRKSVDIDRDFEGLDELIDNMFETMYKADGLGLAAPQIGKNIRLFVVDGTPISEDEPELEDFKKEYINAHIVEREGERIPMNEGCLSIPNIHEDVDRESRIRIQYYDRNWEFHDEVLEGYKARILQHEYDHLDGILFTDKVSPIRRRLLKSKLSSLSKGKFEARYKSVLAK